MKYIQYITILILLFLLIFGWLHYSNKTGKLEQKYLREKIDSAASIHFKAIRSLQKDKAKVIEKSKKDSVTAQEQRIRYEKTIASLTKKQKAIHYTGNTETIPKDSIKIMADYYAQKTVNDSISRVKYNRIAQLEQESKVQKVDCSELLSIANKEIDHTKKLYEDQKSYSGNLETLNKKQGKKGLINGVKIALVALGAGFVIGLSE